MKNTNLYAFTKANRFLKVSTWLIFSFGLFSTACDGMSGCAGNGPSFPNKDKIQSAIQVRVTESGFDTIGQTVTPIIKEALPPELNSCLPGDSGSAAFINWRYCNMETCTNGETGCDINISVGEVTLNAEEPNKVRASVLLDQLALRFDVGADPIVDCDIAIDGPDVPVNVDIILTTPEPQRNLGVLVSDAVYELTDISIRLEGNDGFLSPLCEILDGGFNLPFIRDLVLGLLGDVVDNVLIVALQGVINDFICLQCETDEDPVCLSQGGSCFLGSCIREDLSCVTRPLGVEGESDLGELLSSVTPNLEAPMSYFLNPGSYAEVINEGLSLGVITGTGAELNRCVPPALPPNIEEPPRASALENTLSPNGQEFDVGLAISQTMIDQALWAVYTSGVACLSISSATVAQLNSGTLGILLPNLSSLTRGPAPIAITLAPQRPPQAIIGENRLGPADANGERELEDPLLTIDWPDLWLDFHAFMENRWTRIFSLKVKLVLPLGVAFDPNGGVIPLLGDLNAALTDIEVANDQILIDDTSRIATLLPTLTGPLIGTALSSLSDPIALPEIFGFALAPQDDSIIGISEGEEDFIALFANLVQVIPAEGMDGAMDGEMEGSSSEGKRDALQQKLSLSEELKTKIQSLKQESLKASSTLRQQVFHPVKTLVKLKESFSPPISSWIQKGPRYQNKQDSNYPSITLELSALERSNTPTRDYEFSWRVNGQAWHPFTQAQELIMRDPAFMLPGSHLIEVRARAQGDQFSLDPEPVELSVTLYDLPQQEVLETQPLGLIGRVDPNLDPSDASAGCACDSHKQDRTQQMSSLVISACLLLLFLGLRPQNISKRLSRLKHLGRVFSILFLCLFTLSLIACDDETKPRRDADECNQANCGENQICFEGTCSTVTCIEDSECSDLNCEGDEFAICGESAQCECPSAPLCPEGCAENEYCCYQSNSCERTPSPCADLTEAMSCPAGFELGATTRGQVNPQSCMLENEICECVESNPLEIKSIGRHSDLTYDSNRGTIWLSAYVEDFGDLVVGQVGAENNISWQWVDGVPSDAPVTAAPSGPRGGVSMAGANVGQYSSIAIAPDASLHIAYMDLDQNSLKYALGTRNADGVYSWSIMTLDGGGVIGTNLDDRSADEGAGWWTDITLDQLGRPCIVYRALQQQEAESTLTSSVRFITALEAQPSTNMAWGTPQELHTVTAPENLMSLGYPEGTALFNHLVQSPSGLVAVWYDRSGGNLMMAQKTESVFAPAQVVAGWSHESRRGDFGANANVAVDENGALHYCYQDGATDSLRYLSPELERDEWVDDGIRLGVGGREHALHVVGEDCSLAFDERGRIFIVYQDATGHELLIARRDDSGSWLRITVRGPSLGENQAASGFYARSFSLGETVILSHYQYDHQVEPPRQFLEVLQVPTP